MNVTKRTTTVTGASWLRRAQILARGLSGSAAARREIIDGYMIEAKKVGARRSASVIDIPGRLAMLGANSVTGSIADLIPCGGRDGFNPLLPLMDTPFGGQVEPNTQALTWGPPVTPGAVQLSYGGSHGGRYAVYTSDVLELNGVCWTRVFSSPAGVADRLRSVVIHDSILRSFAPGFEPLYGEVPAAARLQEPIPAVVERGVELIIATNMFLTEETPVPSGSVWTVKATIVFLLVDTEERVLSGVMVPFDALPSVYQPGTITIDTGISAISRPAQSRMVVVDMRVLPSGDVVAGLDYAVEIQDGDGPSWLSAAGRVTWSGSGAVSVDMFDMSLLTTRDSPRLSDLGLPIDTIRSGVAPAVMPDGSLLNVAAIFARKEPGQPGAYDLVPPYSMDTINGTQVATAAEGSGAMFSASPDNPDVVHVFGLGTTYCPISTTTIACRRADPSTSALPSGIGVLFTDGIRFRYESLGDMSTPGFHVTCPQLEVRSDDGELVCPSTVLASFQRGGERFVGIRKGPVWEEDGWDSEAEYWSIVPAPESGRLQAPFYIGNPAMPRRYGAFFVEQPND